MQKAKERVQEVLPSYEEEVKHSDIDRDELKKEINQLCVTYLPSTITIAQFEAIATTCHDMMLYPYDYINK